MATQHIITSSSIDVGRDGSRMSSSCSCPSISINSLPDSILQFIGDYLPRSSRAMLASVLLRSACFNSDTLDFSDIERDLASKLTDADVSSILVSIDAVNRLRVLKIIGCTNISGVGLEPIRGSTTIQQIDLSTSSIATIANGDALFSSNFPWCFSLSEEAVIPILESIIARKDGSLKHLQFPIVWRKKKTQILSDFLERYNNFQSGRPWHACCECCDEFEASLWMDQTNTKRYPDWGLQRHTCYTCRENICHDCEQGFCQDCRKQFCEDCCPMMRCEMCQALICSECEELDFCEDCGVWYCPNCMPVLFCECCERARCLDCVPHWNCSRCWKSNCDECAHEHNVQWCEVCDDEYCNDCRLKDYNNGELDCKGCRGLLLPRIMHEKEALSRENEMLKFVVIKALNEIDSTKKVAHEQEEKCISV